MTVFTSYYRGEIRGEAVSISLYPPKNWKGKHLPLFAPTPELLWWKASAQDTAAQSEYTREFRKTLDSRQQLIQLWVRKQKENPQDITLCCFEKTGDFCHRYQVGEEILQELWGGEVGADQLQLTLVQGKTNHPISSLSELAREKGKEEGEKVLNPKPINLSPLPSPHPTFLGWQTTTAYSPLVSSLIEKCHALGYPVMCDRIPCGYYRVSLHGEDLGDWSELGVLAVLSGLQQEFYRGRLLLGLAAVGSGC
ncbi:hypothetical protein COO91_09708 (plasmid) [Nostoc flagelliforme CCNUN1]|uniref:DUF488 domain-containing protein n=1 Tax=Nostoc flagelliforme CCNUN1 TaxID=2038116 RepID=A0A2K8T759_9NOSO|nr:DUF488 domain-containing protein [Nostoc flagelliforme]AUB43527.1 hypothetical protein COO91_09708 [Nostoc flagelliforme CCNUN1]